MSEAFRTRRIFVTSAHYEALEALAAANGDIYADDAAERLLGAALEAHAALPWLIERRKAMRETLKVEYAHELAKRKADGLNEGEPDWPSPKEQAKIDMRGGLG